MLDKLDFSLNIMKILLFRRRETKEAKFATAEEEVDAKSRLNEYASKHGQEVSYKMVSQSGPVHKPTFIFEVYVGGVCMGNGRGSTKQSAQQWAAKEALQKLL